MMNEAVTGSTILSEQDSHAVMAARDGWWATYSTILTEHTLLVKFVDENPNWQDML